MKFIHAADVHLDSPLRGLERYEGAPLDELRGASRRALEALVDQAITEEVAFLLLAGDLYDGDWKDYRTGLFFIRQMGRLREAGIPVLMIAGNHDAASQITKVLRPPDNVHVFSTRAPETRFLEDLGVAVHGQGFAARAVTVDLSRGYPAPASDLFNIGLLHTSLDGRVGHEPYAPCGLEALKSRGYQYWALGHVHQREILSEEPWVVFPGNLQGRHVREAGAKGCSLVQVEEGRVIGLRHLALDSVRWGVCPVDLTDAGSIDEVLDRLGPVLRRAVAEADGRLLAARIRLVGPCAIHARLLADSERVLNECRALAMTLSAGDLWIEKLAVETRATLSDAAAMARDDAYGSLLRAIRDLEFDPARLADLADDLSDLMVKLPEDLRTGDDGPDLSRPGYLHDRLAEAKALLLEHLLDPGRADESAR